MKNSGVVLIFHIVDIWKKHNKVDDYTIASNLLKRYNLIFDSPRRKNSPKMAYLCQIPTVFVLHRYYVIYCLCFVSLMIFLMLLFVMI